jgi:hypothetical protein
MVQEHGGSRVSATGFMANVVAAAHIGYFLFVIGGSIAIVVGAAKRWGWIRNLWFRLAHVASVYVVIIEDIFNFSCPLNTIEADLRVRSDSSGVASSTAGHLLDYLLHQTIPSRVLDVTYWSLGAILIVLLFVVPPRLKSHSLANRAV